MKDVIQKIYDYSLEEIMGERFGKYCKYIIQDRAIPDVRDGLKPVQRRILYAMYKMKNTYDKPYNKCANAVGETMGKYHPHGDSSIYEAMVRMSQSWKNNSTLIDMKGNNGSIDGDSPAAYRYTEARISKIAAELLKDIDKNIIKWAPNYDDKREEPTVLPARYPNLLVNGANGISAGYATNIPPHNLGETIDGTIYRIDNPNSSLEEIMQYIKGPDFPTKGIIEGLDGIKDAYQTGRGRIIVKSKYNFVKNKGLDQLIIDEIPYDVNKANLVRRIDELRVDRKIEGISEVRDESDKDGLRIVVDLKKDANHDLIINYLLKNTDLQISYNFNVVAIVNRRPKLLGLLDILDAYIKHQKEIITKRTKFDLEHAQTRFHIIEGLMKALGILDQVIATIRASKNKADAQANLVKEYNFTDVQAEAIVMLQLYRLTNTDVTALQQELDDLTKLISMLIKILSDEKYLKRVMKDELMNIKNEYAHPRLTEIKDEITEIKIDTTELINKEDVIVVVTHDGYVKRVSLRSYSAVGDEITLLKEGDYITGLYEMNTLNTLLLFTDMGNYLYVPVHEIPDTKWKELGKHISNIINIKAEESIIYSMPVYNFEEDKNITIFTALGMIKRTKLNEYKVQRYSKPITCIKLKDNDKVVSVSYKDADEIFIATHNGYGLRYDINEVPIIGIKASGVKAINLKDDYVISGIVFNKEDGFISLLTDKGTGKRIKIEDIEKMSRPRKGIQLIREVKTNPHRLIKIFINNNKEILGLKTTSGIIYLKINEMPIMDRHSTGTNITKDIVIDAFISLCLEKRNKEEKEVIEEVIEKQLTLDEIDDEINQINDILDDIKL
ncbi:MAG: DNA topoisomerase IV subunit A [Bacilli bacterium]|nr:DNA topoisomerase IV subunit A [Bacilli bacterium]